LIRLIPALSIVVMVAAFPKIASADDDYWYRLEGNTCHRMSLGSDPTQLEKTLQQEPNRSFSNGMGGSLTDKSAVPGVVERVTDDGHGHVTVLIFVQGNAHCQQVLGSIKATGLYPYQQRAKAH
jgi:hypothetical protein